MSSFTDPLLVEVLQGERNGRATARILEPFTYHIGAYPSADRIVVQPGFVTDFASIPWWARWLFAPFDRAAKAAVLHDWLVSSGDRPRPEIDGLFREAMQVLGVPGWRRWAMWAAVRIRALA